MNVCDLISNNARARADLPALVEGERVLTYRALDRAVRQAATELRVRGIGPGCHVGFVLRDNAEHVVLWLAAARLGAVAVTLDWRSPAEAQAEIVRLLDVEVVLADPALAHLSHAATVAVDEEWRRAVAAAAPLDGTAPGGSAPLAIGTTSGTTGRPKGVLLSHAQLIARAAANFLGHRWRLGDRYFSASPFVYTIGRTYPLFHLMAGNTVILYPPFCGPDEYVAMAAHFGATATFAVPSTLRRLLNLGDGTGRLLEGVRVISTAGEPMAPDDKREAARRLAPAFIDCYGATGTGVVATQDLSDPDADFASAGRCLPSVRLDIVADDGGTAPAGEVGRLRFAGPVVADAFYRGTGPEDGDESFDADGYYPGDVGHIDERGLLFLAGRRNDLIIRGGANILAGEVEAALCTHDAVAEAAVIGWPSRTFGEEVAAFVVLNAPVDKNVLIRHCRDRLAAYKVPRDIFVVDDLPLGPTGKRRKADLAARLSRLP